MIDHPARRRSLAVTDAAKCAARLDDVWTQWRKDMPLDELSTVVQCACFQARDALQGVSKHDLAEKLWTALTELKRFGEQLRQGVDAQAEFEESIDYFAEVLAAIRTAVDDGPRLNATDLAVAELVFNEGPLSGKIIAARLPPGMEISDSHVRRVFSDKLKHYGFNNPRNGTGYHAPSRRTWA